MGDAARKLPAPEQGTNVVAGPWAARASEPSLKDRTADVFARVLPTAWPGYAPRDGQMVLTGAIADTLSTGGVLLAEGPCGTGKGLAYLVPAILAADKAGKTVVVVTASIALQEQLVQHDLPALAEALKSELSEPLTWTLLKGRGNYLCKHAADEPAPIYLTTEERAELHAVDAWARTTETGDRLELPMIVRDGVWAVRSMSTDDCLRDGCDHFDACFARKAKAKAEGVRVLVINYHLLFAHIAVRRETMQDVVIPKTATDSDALAWDTVLCDEAHEAGDIARDFLGCDLTERMVTKLASWVKADGEGRGGTVVQQRNELAARIEREAAQLWRGMVDRVPRAERGRPDADRTQRLREGLGADALMVSVVEAGKLAASVAAAIRRHGAEIEPDERKAMRKAENTHRRALKVASWLDAAICPAEAPHVVLWLEVRTDKRGGERATLHGRVLDVGSVLRDELFARARAVVLASATLTTGAVPRVNALGPASGSDAWGWIRAQLGLPGSTPALAVASPFDFARQAVLCLPTQPALPSPVKEREAFDVEVCHVLEQVSRAASGRTLGLFTSRRMAERAAEHLRAVGVPFPVLCQGDRPRPLLLAAMKAGPCVLCATSSFWTGVDLSGESVVAVVIDKMPFPGPDDPVLAALSELALARTGDQWAGWREESLPRATLALRQGAGRLIRSVGDWGAVVVCDPRLSSARYGASVVKALGMPAQVRSVDAVVQWFAARADQMGGGAR